jgi:hypothetical protein
MEYYSELKRENSVICDNVDDPGVHRAKWTKPGAERQVMLFICGIP